MSGAAPGSAGEATSARGAALVMALALGARLAVVAWAAGRIPPVADGAFYHTIATRIADGLGYTWLWPDGAVTYAGHYPVGYPALVGAAYWLAGPHPPAAMLANAVLGALAAVAAYSLAGRSGGRRAAVLAGVLVALHPGLLAYTPAMMTEGVTAALVACAAWAAMGARRRRGDAAEGLAADRRSRLRSGVAAVSAGAVIGLATLVRPQSLVLAPIFGWLAARGLETLSRRRAVALRLALAGIAAVAALAVCAPWTARNCVRMKRCALVSYNGGWNLLIGADEAATGTWAEIKVPSECREVFDEAEKDVCFGGAARRFIAEHPGEWLSLGPKKLAATFDYAGAGGWYLHAANPAAFPDGAKTALGAVETVFERAMLILALLATARGPWRALRVTRGGGAPIDLRRAGGLPGIVALGIVALGVVSAVTLHAWVAYVVLGAALLAGASLRRSEGGAILPAAAAAVLLSLAVTHAVFFGAGRYSLVAFPLVTAVAALAVASRSGKGASNSGRNAAVAAAGAE